MVFSGLPVFCPYKRGRHCQTIQLPAQQPVSVSCWLGQPQLLTPSKEVSSQAIGPVCCACMPVGTSRTIRYSGGGLPPRINIGSLPLDSPTPSRHCPGSASICWQHQLPAAKCQYALEGQGRDLGTAFFSVRPFKVVEKAARKPQSRWSTHADAGERRLILSQQQPLPVCEKADALFPTTFPLRIRQVLDPSGSLFMSSRPSNTDREFFLVKPRSRS